jgi:hypothetical protein
MPAVVAGSQREVFHLDRLLTKQEVCDLFNVSTRTFDRWRSEWSAKGVDVGEVKIRRTVRFKPAKIQHLIDTERTWL